MANLKWNSATICLEAKEPVATAGLRLAREQSLTVRLLNLLTIANASSTTTVLDFLPAYAGHLFSIHHLPPLPYRPAITFRQTPIVAAVLTPSLWVRQPSPPYDCSPIAVLNLQQIHFAAFWALQLQPHCPAVLADKLLDFFETKLRWSRRVHNCYSESSGCQTKHHQPHLVQKLTYPILENNRANWTFPIASLYR